MDSIKIVFIDIPGGVAVTERLELDTTFHDFTALLFRVSGSERDQIKDLGGYELEQKGFNLSDGAWLYRIVKLTSTDHPEANSSLTQAVKGEWLRVANLYAYNKMRSEIAADLTTGGGWVEIEHVS